MKLLLISFIALVSLSQPNGCNKKKDCVGKPKEDCVCIQVYKPVCGCDGKTYANACLAQCSGVKSWTEGECAGK